MTVKTTRVKIITANLRKDMSAKMWEAGLRIVLERMTPLTIVGIQEAYTRRNTAILKRVCHELGYAILGAGTDSAVVYDPIHVKVLHHKMHPVEKSRRLFVSPTRFSLTAQFQVIATGELFGVLVNHRMNGVYTADAPLHFFAFRKSAWVRHRAMDTSLVRSWTHVDIGSQLHHVPMFCLGDENAHANKDPRYSYEGNPFDDAVTVIFSHHVSDYVAVSRMELTPHHKVEVISRQLFHDHSDHLAIEVVADIHHTVKEAA